MSKQTVVLDFDGVLHSYTSGWKGATVIPDPPVEGAREFCEELLKEFDVIVVSTRCSQPGGPMAVSEWLNINNFPSNVFVSPDGKKPPSIVTIDDRAICFTGVWPTIEDIKAFKPWNKK